jgi:ABC-type multidrug transport system fused ATPase/permease subunit
MPSGLWLQGGKAIWRSLAFRQRGLILLGIMVPALDQISRLGSLGITMKAISRGVRQPLDLDSRLWLGLVILGASGLSALIAMFSNRVKKNLKTSVTRIARKIHGRMMAATSILPLEEREAEIANLVNEEKNFMNSATSGVIDLIDFVAAVLLVIVLVAVLTWFNWIVGLIILSAGLIALLVLRFKVKLSPKKEIGGMVEARRKLTHHLKGIAEGRSNLSERIEDYADNEFDKLTLAEQEAKTSLQKKISSAMGIFSAFLMAVVFILVSSKGAFDEQKIVWMVVFIFGLRMVVSHGKSAIVNWGAILSEKKTLMAIAQASLDESALDEQVAVTGDETTVETAHLNRSESGARIVEFHFSGPNGSGIASRELINLEILVESAGVIDEFNWSFAISRLDGVTFLITKSSDDYGISWTLPTGRSRFQMTAGPLWLAPGTYSMWMGISQQSRALDLVGSKESPVVFEVLPNEIDKKLSQIRFPFNSVLMDVNWATEFKVEQ